MSDKVRQTVAGYIQKLSTVLQSLDVNEVTAVAELLHKAREQGRFVYIMGNGGSASNASHIQSDINKSVSGGLRLRALSLNDNVPAMLALANDLGYENVFVEQLKTYLAEGDIVIAISGSGNSPNVVAAVRYANEKGAVTVALVGYDGGALKQIARHVVHVRADDMQISEDLHLAVGHMLMRALSQ